MKQDKLIDLTKPFEANGKKFEPYDSLPLSYYEKMEELTFEVGFGVTFVALMSNIKKAWDLLNKFKIAEAIVVLHNIMVGAEKGVSKRENPALILCTLFFKREDEERKIYDHDLALSKIEDWRQEGIDFDSFLVYASVKSRQLDKKSMMLLVEALQREREVEDGLDQKKKSKLSFWQKLKTKER